MISGHILGAVILLLGLVSLVSYAVYFIHQQPPTTFIRLRPMQERWGQFTGVALHFLSYVIAPITFGTMLMIL